MSIAKLGESIGMGMKDSENQKTEFIKPSTINSRFLFKTYKVNSKTTRFKVETRSVGSAFILGSPTNAILGTSTLGEGSMGAWTTVEEVGLSQELTYAGKNEFAKWLNSNSAASSPDSATPPTFLALGTDGSQVDLNDLGLGNEKYRQVATTSTDSAKATYQIIANSRTDLLTGETIKELGLISDGSSLHTIDITQGGANVNLTLGTHATLPDVIETNGPGIIPPSLPYIIYGIAKEIDNTGLEDAQVTAVNLMTEESIVATTDSDGNYVIDLGNLPSGYNNGDKIIIRTSKLFARYVLTDLVTDSSHEYRFSLDVEFFDLTEGDALITSDGLDLFRDWFIGTSVNPPSNTGWGIGTNDISINDSSLEGEQERNAFISQRRVDNVNTYEAILTISEMNDLTVRKTGLFNAGNVAGTSSTINTSVAGQEINFTIT